MKFNLEMPETWGHLQSVWIKGYSEGKAKVMGGGDVQEARPLGR